MRTEHPFLLGAALLLLLAAPFQRHASASSVGNATGGLAQGADKHLKQKPVIDVIAEYLPVKIHAAGKNHFTGKTRTTSELLSVCDAFYTDISSKYNDVVRAHAASRPPSMGPIEGLDDFENWYAHQITIVGGISFWYVPFVEWQRVIHDHTERLQKGAERAPKKFAELHKLMKEANAELVDVRQNCKIGSEKEIKRHLRHAARARATAVNVQEYVVETRESVVDNFDDPTLSASSLKAAGEATLKILPTIHASTATHSTLRDFHAPAAYAMEIAGVMQLYEMNLNDYKKAAKPLTEQTIFSDLEFFKGLPFDSLLKNVEAEQERCKTVLHDHRMKYDPHYRKRNGG